MTHDELMEALTRMVERDPAELIARIDLLGAAGAERFDEGIFYARNRAAGRRVTTLEVDPRLL